MGAVHVGVSRDDYLMVAQLGDVEDVTNGGTKCNHEILNLL